ncbi:unnamed protein product, partial [Hapterophycus canaliculatus]
YVGQWRNGKSHGEGTYYYATGARYEGQFDGGKCHGRGTYYYANVRGPICRQLSISPHLYQRPPFSVAIRYEGEWKDDMKWGFGTALYLRKAYYEGHFFMDKRHGYGRMRYSNAGTYEVCPSLENLMR